jgi:enoyl-CoA hydratase/carnithine racemase
MSYSEILYNVADGVAIVTLNRPQKLNAWTTTMEQEVAEAMQAAEADPSVRVIVLTGAGRGFCAGADMANLDGLAQSNNTAETLKELMGKRFGPKPRAGVRQDFQQTYSYLLAIEKPILCAINGPVAGLGLVITLYCDLRLASDQARFSTAFARRGLIAEHGISWLLPRLVGVSNALDLLYSARLIDAAEALRIGLVNRVIPQAEFEAEVRKYALELASASSPRSTRVIKRQVYNAIFQNLSEAIETANEEMVQSFASRDFKEGVAHFLEKRPPAFTGK